MGILRQHMEDTVAVIGGGPAGLMAAEVLLAAGRRVVLYDAMPSLGRKFLLAGKGGLNLTHAEPWDVFVTRFPAALEAHLRGFTPADLRAWAHGLGVETFTGTSGRVFPMAMKAAPLLRTWLVRLRAAGLIVQVRHRWLGWTADGDLCFAAPAGEVRMRPAATVLALGGASWPQLGSDGAWAPLLAARDVAVAPLRPANMGFEADWSAHLRERGAGQPLKHAAFTHAGRTVPGEAVITDYGIEGGAIYALSAALRDGIERDGAALLHVDLLPARRADDLARALARPRGKQSLSSHVRRATGLSGVAVLLLHEVLPRATLDDPAALAAALKALPLRLLRPRPVDEAISSAGGVRLHGVDANLMVRALPGTFVAGEMLDWEAPTGGYLLTACFALGRAAGTGAAAYGK